MAIATGAGAEVQRPRATVVIGGIINSTLLTSLSCLFCTPGPNPAKKTTTVVLCTNTATRLAPMR